MVKNIIKEIIILLLMVLAIILVLGILLYDYVPNNKIIPDKVAYTTPENVSSELQTDSEVDTSEVLVTYQIDATDYKKTKDYVAGKSNPFESIIKNNETEKNTTTGTSSNTNGSGTSQSSTTSSNTQNTNNNTEGYLPDKGTK